MKRPYHHAVDFNPKIKSGALLWRMLDGSLWAENRSKNRSIPPSPPFSKIFGIIGLAGNSPQDRDFKELRY